MGILVATLQCKEFISCNNLTIAHIKMINNTHYVNH